MASSIELPAGGLLSNQWTSRYVLSLHVLVLLVGFAIPQIPVLTFAVSQEIFLSDLWADPDQSAASGPISPAKGQSKWTLQSLMGPLLYGSFHSAVLNITATIGVGILSLPDAMGHLRWTGGILFLFISWVITGFSLWQLVEMSEGEPGSDGKRDGDGGEPNPGPVYYKTYADLAKLAFGKKGVYVVQSMQLVVFVGTCIVYMVAGGACLLNAYKILCARGWHGNGEWQCNTPFGLAAWIVVFSSLQLILSQIPDFSHLTMVSFIAALMSICYSIIITAAISDPSTAPSQAPAPFPSCEKDHFDVFSSFAALGFIAYAYAGHNVVVEIQDSIPTSDKMPSKKKAMLWGISVTYAVVGICYFAVAISGYVTLGHAAVTNVLGDLGYLQCRHMGYGDPHLNSSLADRRPKAAAAASIMLAVHLCGTYQIFAIPVYNFLEDNLQKKFHFCTNWRQHGNRYVQNSFPVVVRSLFIASVLLVALGIPDFGSLLGVLGGLLFAPTTYFLPCLLWLKIRKPKPLSLMWVVNWAITVLGVVLMILSSIGNFRVVQRRLQNYEHWAFH